MNKQVESSSTNKEAYLSYQRHKLVDRFYQGHHGRIRVTTDPVNGSVIASVIKERIADLHVHFPNSPFDIRISLNLEKPLSSLEEKMYKQNIDSPLYERIKNRVSYTLNQKTQTQPIPFLTCDLTQVSASSTEPMTHEFEVELCNSSLLMKEKTSPNDAIALEEIVAAYWTSIRQLAFAAKKF